VATDADPIDPRGDATNPPGVRAQIAAVIAAIRRVISAHVELAKAEAGEIMGEVGRVAALGGLAFGVLFLAALLLPIGGLLFLGEWLFGSIGWGVLLGGFLLLDIAVLAVLVGLGINGGRLGLQFASAAAIGIAVGLALGAVLRVDRQVAAALGTLVWLLAWPGAMGIGVSRSGVDTDALKARFWPSTTIETTKETIEWVRRRTPLGPKS
jgi:hypothetical protein